MKSALLSEWDRTFDTSFSEKSGRMAQSVVYLLQIAVKSGILMEE